MEWVFVVVDDGKDGCFLGAFIDEAEAAAYAEHIGPAEVQKAPLLTSGKHYGVTTKLLGSDARWPANTAM